MKRYLVAILVLSVYNNVAGLRYNVGLYRSAVETMCSRISNGLLVAPEAIKHELNFLDGRDTATILESKYGQKKEFEKLMSVAFSDDDLQDFAKKCENIFNSGNNETKATVHLLLNGVLDHRAKNRSIYRKTPIVDFQYFDDGGVSSFLEMFHLDKISV